VYYNGPHEEGGTPLGCIDLEKVISLDTGTAVAPTKADAKCAFSLTLKDTDRVFALCATNLGKGKACDVRLRCLVTQNRVETEMGCSTLYQHAIVGGKGRFHIIIRACRCTCQ
jgi:hypothetical protein